MQCHILFTTVGYVVPALVILIFQYILCNSGISWNYVHVHVAPPYKFSSQSLTCIFCMLLCIALLFSFRLGQSSQPVKPPAALELDMVTHQSVSMILMLTQPTQLYSSCGDLMVVRYSETAGYFI